MTSAVVAVTLWTRYTEGWLVSGDTILRRGEKSTRAFTTSSGGARHVQRVARLLPQHIVEIKVSRNVVSERVRATAS